MSDDIPTTVSDPPTGPRAVEVAGRLCVWRVLDVVREFRDRGSDSWMVERAFGPQTGDRLKVTVGDIPAEFVRALMFAKAHNVLAMHLAIGALPDRSDEELDQALEESALQEEQRIKDAYGLDLKEGPPRTYVTVELTRPIRTLGHPTRGVRWLHDPATAMGEAAAFAEAADPLLNTVVAGVLNAMDGSLRAERLLFSEDRAYLLAEGREAWCEPRIKGSANATAWGDGWGELPFEEWKSAIDGLAEPEAKGLLAAETPARWLNAAMAAKDDNLRRFLFAFFGLEVLANKLGARIEDRVVSDLSVELGDVPFDQLVWPSPSDESRDPWRNLAFRFTIIAVHLNRGHSVADVAAFREILKARNDLAHGQAHPADFDAGLARRAEELLRQYCGLAVHYASAW